MTSQSTSSVIRRGRKDKPWQSLRLAIVLVAISIISRPSGAEWFSDARPMMGTEISVYLWHDDPQAGAAALEAVFAEAARIDRLMSTYIEDSVISSVNRGAAAGPVQAGDELTGLVLRSLDISTLTHGAFDITYDSVGQYYNFRQRQRPDAAIIEEGLKSIDYRLVEADRASGTIRFLQDGVRINLGGIAKGYTVERGVAVLRRHGVRHARVTAGGDTRLLGDRRGQPWTVGVRDPRDDSRIAVTIPLENEAISTSGDYERFFLEDGERYHHIIQPMTGKPANGIHSATIIGPDAVITDALSTSVFVMGVDEGLRLVATLPDYEGVVIDADGRMYYSDGLRPPTAVTVPE